MQVTGAIERIARLAHDLWREDLVSKGWAYSPEYDPDSKRHDALVPFDQLGKYDKRRTRFVVWAEELESSLIRVIGYDRGPTRPLTIEEMQHGLPVVWNTEYCSPKPVGPPDAGRITDWATDEEGFLCSITVEWKDGTHSEHLPEERDLKRCWEEPIPPKNLRLSDHRHEQDGDA